MGGKALAVTVTLLTLAGLGVAEAQGVSAATTVETNAVNWAVGKIGSTSYGQLCLKLVTDAYQTGAGFNIESLTNFGAFNSSTYPQEVWNDGFKSGTTGGSNTTPPYGALVFFNASGPGANDPADFSHVTIMASGGEMISTNDVVNENAVHYETFAQVQARHPYNTYVGWWLPDGTPSGTGGGALGITSPLVISAPSGWYQFAPIDETFTVTNESGVAASIQRLVLAVRDPFNAGYDQVCAVALTLQAGQSKTCTLSNPWGSSGTFTVWPDWLDYNGNWHQGQLGPNQTFTLAPADTITTLSLPAGVMSKPYHAAFAALGGSAPYTWSISSGSLPAGLALSPAGVLTGIPAKASASKLTVKVADASTPALTATRTYTITIAKATTATTMKLSIAKVTFAHEQTERLSVKVSPEFRGALPSGRVTIRAARKVLCTIRLSQGRGSCRLSATILKPGTYHLLARYSGSVNFYASASASKRLIVARQ